MRFIKIKLLARLTNLNFKNARIFINALQKLAKKPIQKIGTQKVLVIEAPGLLYCLLFSILAAKSTNKHYSFCSIGLNAAVGNSKIASIRRQYLGYIKYRFWRSLYSLNMEPENIIPNSKRSHRLRAEQLYIEFKNSKNKLNFEVDGIRVGDLVIDSYVRFCPSPFVDLNDPLFIEIFIYLLVVKSRFESAIERLQPDEIVTSYAVYLEYGVPVRLALKMGLTVRSYGSDHAVGQLLTSEWPYHTPNVNVDYRYKREKYENSPRMIEFGRRKLSLRTSGTLDPSLNYMRQSAFTISKEVASELENCCVIYAHHFSDSAHIYPNFIYDTFYEWLLDTANQLDSMKQNFFIKPHPSQNFTEVQAIKDLIDNFSYGGLVDNKLSNNTVKNSKIKFSVTAYGTISHELSFLGVPVLACSDNPHSSFTFNIQARSKSEYRRHLKLAVDNKLTTKSDTAQEAALFYSVHNYPPNFKDRLKMKSVRDLRVSLGSEDFDIWPSVQSIYNNKFFQ